MAKKKVAVIHTFLYSVEDLKALFAKYIPDAEMINIIDDSLLQEALANKGITNNARARYVKYAENAQQLGCDVILNQCSSYGECADFAAQAVNVPIVKVDEPMAIKANELGKRIAVIATAISTVGPSTRLVEKHGGPDTVVTPCYVDGAYDALLKDNDKAKHDALITAKVKEAAKTNDVIVLAQGSMFKLVPMLEKEVDIPILSSFEMGVEQLKKFVY